MAHRPRGSGHRVVVSESATAVHQLTPNYITFYSFGAIWVIIKSGTSWGFYVTPDQHITLPPDTYDFIMMDQLSMQTVGSNTWLWGEIANPETVKELYGDVNLSPSEPPQ